jgi:CheY-like chemotaxis protein
MIIVDSEETYSGLGLLLEKRGHRVIEVANDAQALAKLKQETPDLILMDTDMPPARSLVIARGLRERAHLQEVAIIIATSQKMAHLQGGQSSVGHNDYVIYQGDFEQLKNILQGLQIETPALAATQTGNK